MRISLLTCLVIFAFIYCKYEAKVMMSPSPQQSDPDVQRVLDKAWTSLGGWDAYQNLDSIAYKKHTILYYEDGSIESETRQEHKFHFKPRLSGQLISQNGKEFNATILDESGFYKTKSGERIEGSEESAKSSILSSHFVLFAPFKIVDPGTEVKYMGTDSVNGKKVEVLRASWNPQEHSNHSTSDTWWLHFDAKTGEFVSYLVYHVPMYALIHNLTTTTHKGMTYATSRKTWRVDSLGNPLFLRAEFKYDF